MVACGEDIGVVAHRIVLVVVLYGIGEVDGVGGVCLQGVAEGDTYGLSHGLYVRLLYLRRAEDKVLGSVFQLNELIEIQGYAFLCDTCGALLWHGSHHAWRHFVVPSAVRRAHAGAAVEEDCRCRGKEDYGKSV